MKRDAMRLLHQWRNDPLRMPLVLRGARQVGKSWLAQRFGEEFESFVEINFDLSSEAASLFARVSDVSELLERLALFSGKKITPGETLLFFDEVQECPQALKMLRYFKEQSPDLHVIAAGSLLDFLLEEVGVPVGRVQFLYVYPLSFGEYLVACGREELRQEIIKGVSEPVIHAVILDILKTYMWLGGMPAVVDTWLTLKSAEQCQLLQDRIIIAYQQDFLKYARKNQIDNVDKVFCSAPYQLGNKFKYVNVDASIKSASLKQALELLVKAGVLYQCFHVSGHALPLKATRNEKHFKVFFFDIGLAQRLLGLDVKRWVVQPLSAAHLGALAEQLVAQQRIASLNAQKPPELYYWHREARKSNAEVDFVFVHEQSILPVEVKSNVKGGMKSLHVFLKMHPNSPYGLKISEGMASQQGQIKAISLYALECLVHESAFLK